MKTIVVAASKGGAGKSTVASNLAVAATEEGKRVLLLDLDPQETLKKWWEAREAEQPAFGISTPSQLKAELPAAAAAGFDFVFIDTPSAGGPWLPDALDLADLAVVPVRPSAFDTRALGPTLAAIRASKTAHVIVVTQVDKDASIALEVPDILAPHGPVAATMLTTRPSYGNIAGTGQGITETRSRHGAAEMRALWAEIKGRL